MVETSQSSISADNICSFSIANAARYNGSWSLAFFDGKVSSSSPPLNLFRFRPWERSDILSTIQHSETEDVMIGAQG